MAELGRIEKPLLESFAGKRKLYTARSVYLPENPHEGYKSLFHKYWDEVSVHIEKIEAAGKIRKIFCEHIVSAEEDALPGKGTGCPAPSPQTRTCPIKASGSSVTKGFRPMANQTGDTPFGA
jgi:hypothetical protein